uniref:Uncharacterized protein n=1 Tax=Tolypothrix bouteillei VB521301 TaxID=1479485 RepID=A0A0C1QV71_9CYAN
MFLGMKLLNSVLDSRKKQDGFIVYPVKLSGNMLVVLEQLPPTTLVKPSRLKWQTVALVMLTLPNSQPNRAKKQQS